MQLFYNPDITNETSQFSFSKEESKHIVKVLRKKTGDQLQITNGKGWLFTSEIIIADIKKCTVSIEAKTLQSKHVDVRFPVGPGPLENTKFEKSRDNKLKTVEDIKTDNNNHINISC